MKFRKSMFLHLSFTQDLKLSGFLQVYLKNILFAEFNS